MGVADALTTVCAATPEPPRWSGSLPLILLSLPVRVKLTCPLEAALWISPETPTVDREHGFPANRGHKHAAPAMIWKAAFRVPIRVFMLFLLLRKLKTASVSGVG
jgi:hypothetical protein